MAPSSLLTAAVSLLAKSFSVRPCTSALARCTSVLPVKCLTSQASGRPKKPINSFLIFAQQLNSNMVKQYPGMKYKDVLKKGGQQWQMMSPEQKRPYKEAFQKIKMDYERYMEQLTPAQVEQYNLERSQRKAKKKTKLKKKEDKILGKPVGFRSAFSFFVSENHKESKMASPQEKLKSLADKWKNLFRHQKQVYEELAEDDKVRYENEMKAWEEQMQEIGREDLIRGRSLSARKKAAAPK